MELNIHFTSPRPEWSDLENWGLPCKTESLQRRELPSNTSPCRSSKLLQWSKNRGNQISNKYSKLLIDFNSFLGKGQAPHQSRQIACGENTAGIVLI